MRQIGHLVETRFIASLSLSKDVLQSLIAMPWMSHFFEHIKIHQPETTEISTQLLTENLCLHINCK
jgi:hypothetical protein